MGQSKAESQRYLSSLRDRVDCTFSDVTEDDIYENSPTSTCFQLSFCLLVPARVVDVAEVSTEDTDIDRLSFGVPVCGACQ